MAEAKIFIGPARFGAPVNIVAPNPTISKPWRPEPSNSARN